jgi:Gamma-butyrobetaine hydroxylase-like, N-terminal
LTSQNDGDLELEADGYALRFPAVWLRDNCPCPECLDPGTGQKLTDITAFSATGGRHLQGCYADLDGLASTLAVLRREETP